jgi:hypothetical protein
MADAAKDQVPTPRWVSLARSAGLGLAIAGTIGVGWNQTHGAEEPARFCPADAYIAEDGSTAHHRRDPEQDCAWVDEDGDLVSFDAEGTPVPG